MLHNDEIRTYAKRTISLKEAEYSSDKKGQTLQQISIVVEFKILFNKSVLFKRENHLLIR